MTFNTTTAMKDIESVRKLIDNVFWLRPDIFNCDARLGTLFVEFAQDNLQGEVTDAVMNLLNNSIPLPNVNKGEILDRIINAAAEAMRDKYEELTDVGCGSYLLITRYNGEGDRLRCTEWHLAPSFSHALDHVKYNLNERYKDKNPKFSMWQAGKLAFLNEWIMAHLEANECAEEHVGNGDTYKVDIKYTDGNGDVFTEQNTTDDADDVVRGLCEVIKYANNVIRAEVRIKGETVINF